jgi:hypothetical protein
VVGSSILEIYSVSPQVWASQSILFSVWLGALESLDLCGIFLDRKVIGLSIGQVGQGEEKYVLF